MKEACVLDEQSEYDGVCVKCRKLSDTFRTWELPCSRDGLDKRVNFMVHDMLVLHLTAVKVKAFVKQNVFKILPNSFVTLSLTMGFGSPLRIDAVGIVPRGNGATRMLGFGLSGSGSTRTIILESPPILPLLADRKAIEIHINQWLDALIIEQGSELPEYYFAEEHEQWLKDMLTTICDYYRASLPQLEKSGNGPFQTLRWALKLTLLNHIMSHPFAIAGDDDDNNVSGPDSQQLYYNPDDTEEWVYPPLANRVMKSIALPMLKLANERVLSDLQKMLRSKGDEEKSWDQAFCIVFLCLVIVARTQESLVECALAGEEEGDHSFTSDNAKDGITKMEAELSTHLIGMFHHRFCTNKKENGKGKSHNPLAGHEHDRPYVTSKFAEQILSVTDHYGT